VLFIMLTAVIPGAAHWLVQRVTGRMDLLLSCRLQSIARLVMSVLMPAAVVLMFDNSCFSFWLYFWSPCADDPGRFDTTVSMQPGVIGLTFETSSTTTGSITIATTTKSLMDYFLQLDLPYQVTSHSDICDPSWSKSENCSRGVMAVVGELIYSKLVFFMLVVPGATLFCSLPPVMRVLQCLWRRVMPGVDFVWYRGDTELAFIMLFLEHTFVLGFVAPLLVPLAAIGLALNTAVYHCGVHRLGLPVQDNAHPSLKYLYFSRAVGIAFVMWFYAENDLHGKLLVCIGMPVCVVGAEVVVMYLRRSRKQKRMTRRGLLEPLLGPEEGIMRHSVRQGTEIDLGVRDWATVQEVKEEEQEVADSGGATLPLAPSMLEVQGCALTEGFNLDGPGWQRVRDFNDHPAWRCNESTRGFIYFLPELDFWDGGSEEGEGGPCWAMSCCSMGANPPTYIAAPSGDAELPTDVGGWVAPGQQAKRGMVVQGY